MPTPSHHRTRLGPITQSASRSSNRNPPTVAGRNLPTHTPAHRQPFANISGNTMERPGMNGYGMSAGMKVGRQQTGKITLRVPYNT